MSIRFRLVRTPKMEIYSRRFPTIVRRVNANEKNYIDNDNKSYFHSFFKFNQPDISAWELERQLFRFIEPEYPQDAPPIWRRYETNPINDKIVTDIVPVERNALPIHLWLTSIK